MNKKFFTLAAVATMLAACSSNDEIVTQEENLKDTPITILSAGVADLTARAINDDKSLTGDNASLGLYVENDNENYAATHERWDYNSGWVFNTTATNDATQMLYNDAFTWRAYSPYSIKTTSDEDYLYDNDTFSVPTTGDYVGGWTDADTYGKLTTVSGSQYDLLWGMKENHNSATVDLALSHVLTMLVVDISETYGTEFATAPTIESVTIGGTVVTGTLNLTTATKLTDVVTVQSGDDVITTTPIKTATFSTNRYEALIIPQTVEMLTISVALEGGKSYATVLYNKEFEPGYKYTVSLKLGQDKVEAGTISAAPWGQANDGSPLETE